MSTGIKDSGCKMVKRIVILDAAVPDQESEVEVAYQLPKEARVWLAAASETCIVIEAGTEVGSAAFTVESIVESNDGTNFRTVENTTDQVVDAAGHYRIAMSKRIMAEYVKLMIGTVTLTGSAYLPLVIALECTIDPAKYGV